jgi:parallel beta-helix repeat protein
MTMSALRNWFAAIIGPQPRSRRHRRNRARLAVEILEDRRTPATLNVGPGDCYTTIQAAVNAACPGDTVQVDAGTYQEQVTINKSITLIGRDCSTIILAPTNLGAPSASNPDAIVRVTGAGTTVQIAHLTIAGSDPTQAPATITNLFYGVRVDGGATADLGNDTITNIVGTYTTYTNNSPTTYAVGVAVDIGNSAASIDGTGAQVGIAKVHNDTITNYQRVGVVVNNSGSIGIVLHNTINAGTAPHADSQTGVEVSDGAVAHIKSNAITGNTNGSNGTGVLLFNPGAVPMADSAGEDDDCNTDGGDNTPDQTYFVTTVQNNCISGNDYGVFGSEVNPTVAGQPVSVRVSNGNSITGNTYVGIEFDNSSGVTIANNSLSGNGSNNTADGGIYLYESTNNTISNNTSSNNNGSGIYLDMGSTGNLLKNNTTTGNVYDTTVGNADAVDWSTGSGTAGTGNTWQNNTGLTFITASGQTVFKKSPKAHH